MFFGIGSICKWQYVAEYKISYNNTGWTGFLDHARNPIYAKSID